MKRTGVEEFIFVIGSGITYFRCTTSKTANSPHKTNWTFFAYVSLPDVVWSASKAYLYVHFMAMGFANF